MPQKPFLKKYIPFQKKYIPSKKTVIGDQTFDNENSINRSMQQVMAGAVCLLQ